MGDSVTATVTVFATISPSGTSLSSAAALTSSAAALTSSAALSTLESISSPSTSASLAPSAAVSTPSSTLIASNNSSIELKFMSRTEELVCKRFAMIFLKVCIQARWPIRPAPVYVFNGMKRLILFLFFIWIGF